MFRVPTFALIALAVPAAAASVPTFSKDVAPIFFARCTGCHRPNDIAPMSLLDYKSSRPWAKAIRASVLARKMPPWFADPAYGHFANDARLSQKEMATIQAWVDGGAPEGNAKDLPPAPKFVEGWQMGKPDIVVDMGEDHEV
ncbi:MAG: thiol-disulfide isomerase, partial [Bryobacterales bacterium]|nr:thiol-disulfide isomerase [Bryobacterales bacterium]